MSKKTKTSKTTTAKPKTKGTKTTTFDAGGGIMVDVVETKTAKGTKGATKTETPAISPEQKVANAAAAVLAQTPAPKGKRKPWRERAAVINADHNAKFEAQQAGKTKKAKKAPAEKKPKKVSGLDAAFNVLKAKGEPMTCQAIVDEMLAKGMWKTNGKTPAATIYSSMLREIDGKPGESRFAKTGRGLFAIAKTAKA